MEIRNLDSEQNRTFKDLRQLLSGRGIRKQERALVSGEKIVADMLRNHPDLCEAWISRGSEPSPEALLPRARWFQAVPPLFRELDIFGTDAPLLVVRTPESRAWVPEDGLPQGCSLLLPFQDPENVGAAIRSAAAFGVHQIVLLEESAHPFHPRALRAAAGASFDVPLLRGPSIRSLPPELPVIPLSRRGSPLASVAFPETFGLLPGLEGPGLPDHWRDRAVSIPMTGGVESLNAAAAVAVALYVWSTTRRA